MIKVEMTFASAEEAAEAMGRLAYEGPGESGEVAEAGAPQQRRRRRTKAEMEAARAAETGTTNEAAEAAPTASGTDAASDFLGDDPATGKPASQEREPLTKEQAEAKFKNEVRPALGRVMQAKGQDAARKLLNDFGFAKLTDMPSERFDEFVKLCAAA